MFRWLWPSSNQQPTQEEQWMARREVKEQLAIAGKTRKEWDAMMRKWEANDYKDFNPDYQFTMQTRMRDVRCLVFSVDLFHIEALFPGSGSYRSLSCAYPFQSHN
jgi:hypothetical protein